MNIPLKYLLPLIVLALSACAPDLSMSDPHPVEKLKYIQDHPAPLTPTELPPGLGPDLPPPPSTQPVTPQK